MAVTLTNSGSATPANYQQVINVNSNSYSAYINSAWSNVEFTTGPGATGSVLQAWVQTNASNTATMTIVWVKIPGGVAAGTSTIYMDTMPSAVLSSSGPTGEASELSGTYGQYDNGGNVFALYDSFKGTSLNTSKWSSSYTCNQGSCGGPGDQIAVNNAGELNYGTNWWGSDMTSAATFSNTTSQGWALDYQFIWACGSSGNCHNGYYGGEFWGTDGAVYLSHYSYGHEPTYYNQPICTYCTFVQQDIHNNQIRLNDSGKAYPYDMVSISLSSGIWYPASLQLIPSSGGAANAYYYFNGASSAMAQIPLSATEFANNFPFSIDLHTGNYQSIDQLWFRDVRLRIAVASPPTASLGSIV
ncbi:MAG: DUF2341 domain-containing protein [Candidatus Micrarchaeota archaeon]|nr:DUF2341 domain-containing protein [Candidatus Micrarchaeota archaeon]